MVHNKRAISLTAGVAFSVAGLLSPVPAMAQPPTDNDPAHHTTDVNDPDPAHHRPYVVCSASTNDCTVTPLPGFDASGHPVGGGPGGGGAGGAVNDPDPAHHSTDVNDPDPAHHRPYVVNGMLVPVPGFDLNGNPISMSASGHFFH